MDNEPIRTRPSVRTLIGVIALIIGLTVYSLVIMALAAGPLSDRHIALQTLFYAAAGFAWLWPARWLLRWMTPPPESGPVV